jgi:hypothetical protein
VAIDPPAVTRPALSPPSPLRSPPHHSQSNGPAGDIKAPASAENIS